MCDQTCCFTLYHDVCLCPEQAHLRRICFNAAGEMRSWELLRATEPEGDGASGGVVTAEVEDNMAELLALVPERFREFLGPGNEHGRPPIHQLQDVVSTHSHTSPSDSQRKTPYYLALNPESLTQAEGRVA